MYVALTLNARTRAELGSQEMSRATRGRLTKGKQFYPQVKVLYRYVDSGTNLSVNGKRDSNVHQRAYAEPIQNSRKSFNLADSKYNVTTTLTRHILTLCSRTDAGSQPVLAVHFDTSCTTSLYSRDPWLEAQARCLENIERRRDVESLKLDGS